MAYSLDEFADDFDKYLTEIRDESKITVMVLGPNPSSKGVGAALRRYVVEQCDKLDIAVWGEHEKLIRIYERSSGGPRNLCTYEFGIAKKVDAVVIIPDSPGSFVELGMFAVEDDICRKTFVLVKSKYANGREISFVDLGALRAYDERKATIEYVDYRSKRGAWNKLNNFLEDFRLLKRDRRMLERGRS